MKLRVGIQLVTQLAGDPPHLDGLLQSELSFKQGIANAFTRSDNIPEDIPIPIMYEMYNGFSVPCASSPIYVSDHEDRQHIVKMFNSVDWMDLHPTKRKSMSIAAGPYKSFRVPYRIRHIHEVVYFCKGNIRGIKRALRGLISIGSLRKVGFGLVRCVTIEEVPGEWWWFGPDGELMRPLPWVEGQEPFLGSRRSTASYRAPYWHPHYKMEVALPC